eukprot:1224864-Rhodomonas_salina.1
MYAPRWSWQALGERVGYVVGASALHQRHGPFLKVLLFVFCVEDFVCGYGYEHACDLSPSPMSRLSLTRDLASAKPRSGRADHCRDSLTRPLSVAHPSGLDP